MKHLVTIGSLLLLSACAPERSATPAAAPVSTPASSQVASYTEFNTVPTIRDVMNTLIDPSADVLWNAVRYEVDANGARDYRPETDEEWLALRYEAVAIIEGGNALMIPGRHVAPPGSTTEFPDYEYLPDEVEAKLQEDRQSWIGFTQGLQASAVLMLEAIAARDSELLSEYGTQLDAACESCHMQYWYRSEL